MDSPVRSKAVIGRKSRRSRVLGWMIVVLAAGSGPLRAENYENMFTLAPFFGAQGFPFNGGTHFDVDYYMGLRAGYNFTRNLAAELVFGYNDTVHDPEKNPCNIYQYGADFLYHFTPQKRFVPFVAAGFGGYTVDFATIADSDGTKVYFNLGGGLDYALNDRLSLRADYRHSITTLDDGLHVIAGTVSLRWQFGRK